MLKAQRLLNALFVLILSGVLIAAYSYQFIKMEMPCPLCMLQRLAIMGVAMGPVLNLLFGMKMEHYGMSIFSCIFGSFVSLRQISLHVCPQFPTFGEPVLGFDLYAWCLFVFASSLAAIAFLLMLFGFNDNQPNTIKKTNRFEKASIGLLCLIVVANVITTLIECGIGACKG